MSVVNCKVKFIRPQYKNLKEWIEDENNVYIGRAGIVFIENERFPKKSSPFCNIFKIGKDGTRKEVLDKYKTYITEKINKNKTLHDDLLKLKGKKLGCWCHPEPCHGDILMDILRS